MSSFARKLAIALLYSGLAGCGGGGGDAQPESATSISEQPPPLTWDQGSWDNVTWE